MSELATLAAQPLEWTLKSGKARAAFTAAAQSRAPSAARHAVADAATLAQLKNGQFRPFLRDVLGALSKGHTEALKAHVSAALTVTGADGVTMVPAGDVLTFANKAAVLAFAGYLQAPTAVIKGTTVPKELPKGKQYLCAVAAAWLASMAEPATAPDAPATDAPADAAPATDAAADTVDAEGERVNADAETV